MLLVIEIVALVLAVLAVIGCGLLVLDSLRQERMKRYDGPRDPYSERAPERPTERRPLGFLAAAAVALLAVAATTALVDAKVSDAPATVAPAAEDPAPDYFAAQLKNFRGRGELREVKLRRPLRLVRYFDRARARDLGGGDPGATWWTTLAENRRLTTLAKVRERLALPRD